GKLDDETICDASLRAGPYRVPSELIFAALIEALIRSGAAIGSLATDASLANNTRVPRSVADSPPIARRAASCARFHRSPYAMLDERSSSTTTSRAPVLPL